MAINGFTVCNTTARGGVYKIPGTSRYIQVRREIAPLLLGFAAEFHDKVEPIDNGTRDDWGYACRRVRGRAVVSFHAAGIAIDLNALRHPLGVRNTFNARQRATIRALAKKYGLRWGGDYRNRADEMHVEVILPRAEALALVRRLQSHPPTTKPATKPRITKLKYGARNSDVVLLQKRLLKLGLNPGPTDGIYGQRTRAAVRQFQLRQGWSGRDADGFMGPVTLRRLYT